ncbi:hypothetical protein JCM8097_006966 [Rhodosporidiobolus ruineniae]
MKFATLSALLASTSLLVSAAPAPAPSTTLVPDKPASPGSAALTNAYWLVFVNQLRTAQNLPKISVSNTTLVNQATSWAEQCIYGYETEATADGTKLQAVSYYDGGVEGRVAPIKSVQQAVTSNWREQGLYSIAAFYNLDQLGCNVKYCDSIGRVEGQLVLPQINATNCIFHRSD